MCFLIYFECDNAIYRDKKKLKPFWAGGNIYILYICHKWNKIKLKNERKR